MAVIFYSASLSDYEKNIEIYELFKLVVGELSFEYISAHKEKYDEILGSNDEDLTLEEKHYVFVNKSISQSDACIIEASKDSFRLGHEATLALIYDKPVLCLSRKRDYSKYIKHPMFTAYKYDSMEALKSVLINFMKDVEKRSLTVRFNGMLSPQQKLFLEWLSQRDNKSASEIVRDLIKQKIDVTKEFEEDYKWLTRRYVKNI